MQALNLFYEEPDPDRWLWGDRHPRRLIRRVVRGKPPVGGHQRVFLNLCAGLERLGVPYRVNDYRYLRRHPDEVACIIGKPHLLDQRPWQNPILLGAAIFSHPQDDPHLFERLPIRRVVVPGEWVRKMWEPLYGDRVHAWAVGIDTDRWAPAPERDKDIDVLVYDKVRWQRDRYVPVLIEPIQQELRRRGLSSVTLRYGAYREADFHELLRRVKALIFLCEHETQGIAYQQALSCNVPILAWDRGGDWQDPSYFPQVRFGPVTSVPYWSDRCGMTFATIDAFSTQLDAFWQRLQHREFAPRDYVLDHLTLEHCARRYVELWQKS